MSFSLIPEYVFCNVTDITPDFLGRLGTRFLMLDLDNTIAGNNERVPSDKILRWAENMKNSGVRLFIVSNSRRRGRVEAFAEALGISYIKGARKPSPKGVLRAMVEAGYGACDSALAGDQIFTDTLAANTAGAVSLVVRPKSCKNPFLALRYALELPFRALCRNKLNGGCQWTESKE